MYPNLLPNLVTAHRRELEGTAEQARWVRRPRRRRSSSTARAEPRPPVS